MTRAPAPSGQHGVEMVGPLQRPSLHRDSGLAFWPRVAMEAHRERRHVAGVEQKRGRKCVPRRLTPCLAANMTCVLGSAMPTCDATTEASPSGVIVDSARNALACGSGRHGDSPSLGAPWLTRGTVLWTVAVSLVTAGGMSSTEANSLLARWAESRRKASAGAVGEGQPGRRVAALGGADGPAGVVRSASATAKRGLLPLGGAVHGGSELVTTWAGRVGVRLLRINRGLHTDC